MADLEDFNEGVKLDDFDDVPTSAPNRVTQSAEARAAMAATLKNDPMEMVQQFEQTKEALLSDDTDHLGALTASFVERTEAAHRAAVIDVLGDPEVDPNVKQAAAQGQQGMDFEEMVAEQLIVTNDFSGRDEEGKRNYLADVLAEYTEDSVARKNAGLHAAADHNPTWNSLANDMLVLYGAPFVETTVGAEITEATGVDGSGFLGWNKEALREHILNLPQEGKLQFYKDFYEVLQGAESEGVLKTLLSTNEWNQYDYMRGVIERQDVADWEIAMDNIVTLLDILPFAKPAGKAVGAAIRALSNSDIPLRQMGELNEELARTAWAAYWRASAEGESDLTRALGGPTLPGDVAVDGTMPQVWRNPDDPIDPRTHNIGGTENLEITPSADVMHVVDVDPMIQYWKEEKARRSSEVFHDFSNATGMRPVPEMSSYGKATDEGLVIEQVYGPKDGGFAQARDALMTPMFQLQKYGVTEDNITVLRRGSKGYVELTPVELSAAVEQRIPGEYLAKVDYTYKFNPMDMAGFMNSGTDIKFGWSIFNPVGRALGTLGPSVPRMILDPASMLNKKMIWSANSAVDRAAGIEKVLLQDAKDYATIMQKSDAVQQERLMNYILEANDNGLKVSDQALRTTYGLGPEQVKAVHKWRSYWDGVYALDNRNFISVMRSRGYKVLEDAHKSHRLYAKPIERRQVPENVKVYNPVKDEFRNLSKQEVRQHYEQGGTLAQMKDTLKAGDNTADYVMVANTKGNYLREFSTFDSVLSYRKGYFQRRYEAPYFVRKLEKRADGTPYYRAVAVTDDLQKADRILERMAAQDGVSPKEWGLSGRDKLTDARRRAFDDEWDVAGAGGRLNTRFRGKKLSEGSHPINDSLDDQFIMDPIKSMIASARSAARHAGMTEVIQSQKIRFMNAYGDLVPKGQFPADPGDIARPTEILGSRHFEARQLWEYINYLENGYINNLDIGYKTILQFIADTASRGGATRTGKAAEALKGDVSGNLKKVAFNAYIATNPLRQFWVQSHQALQLTAIEPVFVVKDLPRQTSAIVTSIVSGDWKAAAKFGVDPDEAKAMYEAFMQTGMFASVDKQNLVRGALSDLTEYWSGNLPARGAKKALNASRQAGFDAGEFVNVFSAYLTFRNRMIKAGVKDVDNAENAALIAGEARNFTYNMNFAGDMPYNQNSMSAFMQFMQVPHKALLTMTTNRGISAREKAQLALFNLAAYGAPVTAVAWLVDQFDIEEQWVIDGLYRGFESMFLNKLATELQGEDTNIDFSNLAPLELHGFFNTLHVAMTDPMTALENTPSGRILFGGNSRIANAYKETMYLFHGNEPITDPQQWKNTFHALASVSSGYSNLYKAINLEEAQKTVSSMGGEIANDLNFLERAALAFGLSPQEYTDAMAIGKEAYASRTEYKEDIQVWYKDTKRHLFLDGVTDDSYDYFRRVFAMGRDAFGDTPQFYEELKRLLMQDLNDSNDNRVYRSVMGQMGVEDNATIRSWIDRSPLSEDEKELHKRIMNDMFSEEE